MSRIIKPLGVEETITTEDDINLSRLVRIYAANISVVTIGDPVANTTIGSFTMPAGSVSFVEKDRSHTISGSTALRCTPISYKS
jgi:hypothetical protein